MAVSWRRATRKLLSEALARANGNQSEAARSLRLGVNALGYRMRKHGLTFTPQAKTAAL